MGFQDKLVHAVLWNLRVSHTITRIQHPRSKKWIVELAISRQNEWAEINILFRSAPSSSIGKYTPAITQGIVTT